MNQDPHSNPSNPLFKDEFKGEQPQDRSSWCHVKETVTMLYLAVCQIENSLLESNKSMDSLTNSFTKLAKHINTIDEQVLGLNNLTQLEDFKDTLAATNQQMQHKINSAIVGFQFYDRISQRLDHVARSLEKMTGLMSEPERIHDPVAWQQIQEEVKTSYSMEAERIMFEHIMQGATVKEALSIYQHHFNQANHGKDDLGDEVDLF